MSVRQKQSFKGERLGGGDGQTKFNDTLTKSNYILLYRVRGGRTLSNKVALGVFHYTFSVPLPTQLVTPTTQLFICPSPPPTQFVCPYLHISDMFVCVSVGLCVSLFLVWAFSQRDNKG